MAAILKAPVDLLWFGGIGTYIRAGSETDADAGDRANDAVRITGADLRAKSLDFLERHFGSSAGWYHAIARGARIRLSVVDRRKCALKGEVRIERVAELPPDVGVHAGQPGCFVLVRRSKGNPLEWRRLFRELCKHPQVRPHIA